MIWFGWLLTAAAVGLNLHAVAALGLTRGEAGLVVRRWAQRSGWLVLAYFGLSGVAIALLVRDGSNAVDSVDPSMRAAEFARRISEGINCAAAVVLGSVLPVIVALRLGWKARRG